jgi:2-polyprenyl-3-methyl-5-hydroxy-6-metoxy-1,4-benzoquinol methylase
VKIKSSGSAAPGALREFYDAEANIYDRSRFRTPHQLRLDASERRILRRYLSGLGRVLEVGAGTGRMTGELLARSEHVTAVDISPNMLEKLQQKFLGEKRLSLHEHSVYDLAAIPTYGSFDALVSMRMLPHIEDIPAVLSIFRDAIRPGGLIMTDFWNRMSYRYWKKGNSHAYNNFVTYKEALRMISGARLELVAMEGAGFSSPVDLDLEFLGGTPFKRIAFSLVAVCRRPSDR